MAGQMSRGAGAKNRETSSWLPRAGGARVVARHSNDSSPTVVHKKFGLTLKFREGFRTTASEFRDHRSVGA